MRCAEHSFLEDMRRNTLLCWFSDGLDTGVERAQVKYSVLRLEFRILLHHVYSVQQWGLKVACEVNLVGAARPSGREKV